MNKQIHILSVNAAGLKHKASELKNKLKYFNSTILAVWESQFLKKGRLKVVKFHKFEVIRKSKIPHTGDKASLDRCG